MQVGLRADALHHQVVGEPVELVRRQQVPQLDALGFAVVLRDVVHDEVDLVASVYEGEVQRKG